MSKFFSYASEQRYAQYPRRYSVEYHVDSRRKEPITKGACATLHSAKTNAGRAILNGFCTQVRIFDRKTGQYRLTFKGTADTGIRVTEGYTK